jgi:hypothetical protein
VLKTGKEIAGKLSEVCAYFFSISILATTPPSIHVSIYHLFHSQEHADIYGLKAALGYLHRIVEDEDSRQIGHLKVRVIKRFFYFQKYGMEGELGLYPIIIFNR